VRRFLQKLVIIESAISRDHQNQNHELRLPVAIISFNHQLRPSASKPELHLPVETISFSHQLRPSASKPSIASTSCNHQLQPSAATISIKTMSCIYQ